MTIVASTAIASTTTTAIAVTRFDLSEAIYPPAGKNSFALQLLPAIPSVLRPSSLASPGLRTPGERGNLF
jgi:hypothetical protein